MFQGVVSWYEGRGRGGLAQQTAEGLGGLRRVPVSGDASTTRRSLPRTRRPAEGDALGGPGHRRRDYTQLSRQVAAQVAPRCLPVRHRVATQFHPRLTERNSRRRTVPKRVR